MKKVLSLLMLSLLTALILISSTTVAADNRTNEDPLRILNVAVVPGAPGRYTMELEAGYGVGLDPQIEVLLAPDTDYARYRSVPVVTQEFNNETCTNHTCTADVTVEFDTTGLAPGYYIIKVMLTTPDGDILTYTILPFGDGGDACSTGVCLPVPSAR